MRNPFDNIDMKAFISQFSSDFISEQNKRMLDQTDMDYNIFGECLKAGKCYLCGKNIEDASSEPCLHWLINERIKKKSLKLLLNSNVGFFRIYSYIVWCANTDKPFVNINDLSCNIQPNRHFECTVRYKIWEWSISISKSDYEGHGSTRNGNKPHFHLQIIRNGQIFVKYSDAHIIFTNEDLFKFSMIKQGIMTFDPGYGAGLEALKEEDLQRSLPEWLSQSKNEETAQFRTQTIINTNLPRTILDELFEMHKESGMVMPAIIDKLNKEKGYNIEYYTRTIPNSFPEMNHRTQRGESKKN